jgi:hypothetical protein
MDLGSEDIMLTTLIRAGHTLKNQGIKQSGAQALSETEFGTWRRCRVRRLDVLRAAERLRAGSLVSMRRARCWPRRGRCARGSKSSKRKRCEVVLR